MLIEFKCNFRFEGEAGAFQYDLWTEFISHIWQYTRLSLPLENAILLKILELPEYANRETKTYW
jgi:hypothetical protein